MNVFGILLMVVLGLVALGAVAILATIFFAGLWTLVRGFVNEVRFFLIGREGREAIRNELGLSYVSFWKRDFFWYGITPIGCAGLILLTAWLGQIIWAIVGITVLAAVIYALLRAIHAGIVLHTLAQQEKR